jgi:hypothetical protein
VTGSLEGDRVAFCGSSMMAAMGGGRKGCSMGGGGLLLLKGARGDCRGRRKRWVGRRAGAGGEAVGGYGGGHGPNAVGTVAPLFGLWG